MSNRIKELRKQQKKTLDDIQNETGIKRATFSRYENEKSEPKLATWQKLADYFGVPISYLQGIQTSKNLNAVKIDYLTDMLLGFGIGLVSNRENKLSPEFKNYYDRIMRLSKGLTIKDLGYLSDKLRDISYQYVRFFQGLDIYTAELQIASDVGNAITELLGQIYDGIGFKSYQTPNLSMSIAVDGLSEREQDSKSKLIEAVDIVAHDDDLMDFKQLQPNAPLDDENVSTAIDKFSALLALASTNDDITSLYLRELVYSISGDMLDAYHQAINMRESENDNK